MVILGVETTCDETGIAIIEVQNKKNGSILVLANEIASQIEIHKPYGGVYPMLAKREHEKNLPIAWKRAWREAKKLQPGIRIDAIAIVTGPGLAPCLWVGVNFAKDLARALNLPLIPVNHLEGHIATALLAQNGGNPKFQLSNPKRFKEMWPAMALIVSGGHTQLVLVKNIGEYETIGETRDDAAGECFDKTARILGLPYPGGPAIAAAAAKFPISFPSGGLSRGDNAQFPIKLPRPMMYAKNFDFSFSGLKTAVLYDYQSRPARIQKSREYIAAIAHEIQQAVCDVLISKTMRAAHAHRTKSVILGGGVAANTELREQLAKKCLEERFHFFVSPQGLSTDNGVMAALAGYVQWQKGNSIASGTSAARWDAIGADANLRLSRSRYLNARAKRH